MSKPKSSIPQHLGIIMDGNRRWARQHKLEVLQGHSYVANKVIQPLVERCITHGVKFLTLWAFSTENWQRDKAEVAGLLDLFRDAFHRNAAELHEKGVKLQVIGDLARFPQDLQKNITSWVETTQNNEKITVIFALNYGGRDELTRAINQIMSTNLTPASPITQEEISVNLDTVGLPDIDLIIRPGGEQRLSGFLPWQSIYAELYFTEVLMPDFSAAELDKALAEYAQRQRRFGA